MPVESETAQPRPDGLSPDPLFGRSMAIAGVMGALYASLGHGIGPGIGWSLILLSLVGGLVWHLRGAISTQSLLVLGASGVIALLVALRDLPALAALNLLSFISLVLIAVGLQRRPNLHQWTVSTLVIELLDGGFGVLSAPPGYLRAGASQRKDSTRHIGGRLGSIVVGIGASIFLLAIFGGLLISADAVLESFTESFIAQLTDLFDLPGRLLASLVVAWLTIGVIARFRRPSGTRTHTEVDRHVQAPIILIPLISLNVLFGGFVAIQFAYLFGGADTVARTGLTYAEYARRGFFELVAVAALVVALILFVEWITRATESRRSIVAASRILVVLTLVVAVAAIRRMLLYVEEFGLTELRVYTTTFLIWVGLSLVWMGFTVLRNSRGPFVIGVVTSAFVLTVGLNLAHPAALITSVNLDRAASGAALDIAYLLELGPGAEPTWNERIDEIPNPADRRFLMDASTERPSSDWRELTVDDFTAGSS